MTFAALRPAHGASSPPSALARPRIAPFREFGDSWGGPASGRGFPSPRPLALYVGR